MRSFLSGQAGHQIVSLRVAGLRFSGTVVVPCGESPLVLLEHTVSTVHLDLEHPGSLMLGMDEGPVAAVALTRINGQLEVVAQMRDSLHPGLVLGEKVGFAGSGLHVSLTKLCVTWAVYLL